MLKSIGFSQNHHRFMVKMLAINIIRGFPVVDTLIQKSAEFVPTEGHWRVYYLGFARGGWLNEVQSFAKTFQKAAIKGENWQAVGISLLNLSQVDQDLKDWSQPRDSDFTISF